MDATKYLTNINDLWRSVRDSVIRVLLWSIFVGFLGSIPLLASFVDGSLRGHPPTAGELVGDGELLLICCAVSAESMGRVLNYARKHDRGLDFMRCLLLICGLVTVTFCTILYVDSRYAVGHNALDLNTFVAWSTRIAEATFVVGVWTTLFAAD
jgi:hypothetical protein